MKKGQELYNKLLDIIIDVQEIMTQLKQADKKLYNEAKDLLSKNSVNIDDSPKNLLIKLNPYECQGLIRGFELLTKDEVARVDIANYQFVLEQRPLQAEIISTEEDDEDDDTND